MASHNSNSTGVTHDTQSADTSASTFQNAREATASAYESTRDTVADATRRTGETIAGNPVGALVGGLAVGALLGAVLPTTRRERDALQPLGEKLSGAARDAARQAAESGRDKLDEVTGQVMTKVGSAVVDAVAAKTEA